MTYRAPKGTDDILPPDSDTWVRVERAFLDLVELYGYGLTLTPIFEATEVFERGTGETTEVVEKQMYTFADKGGRSLTLRPEATPSVVRALIQSGGVNGTFKGAYWGPMFRYERPQKGRRRQFYQAGVEYIGEPHPDADVEVIEIGRRFLELLGVADVEVQLNSIGDASDRATYRQLLREFLEERRSELTEDARRRIEDNPLRVLDSKADAAVVAGAPVPVDHLGPAASEHFRAVRTGLDRLGIGYRAAPHLVRGLDYYNRTVWEYVPRGFDAAQSSVGGGGRYDGLFEALGGKPTAAVGLAMGLDRIILAMGEEEARPRLDAYIVVADEARRAQALDLTGVLRGGGLRSDLTLSPRSIKAQFRAAGRIGARVAIVVGAEIDEGNVSVKDLISGEGAIIAVEEIESWVANR